MTNGNKRLEIPYYLTELETTTGQKTTMPRGHPEEIRTATSSYDRPLACGDATQERCDLGGEFVAEYVGVDGAGVGC